ncbi:uncharacterized protein BDV14DRAFT_186342, partial [Aspergillus stella-maris]|uniref:uncharacterized protein n=1 Tax=Aspergillus stella-maris TaxID=1810926 RepID=UPI003CCE4CF8
EIVMLGDLRLTITAFRALPKYFIREAATLCDTLLLGIRPVVRLDTIQDSFTNHRPGHSFITNPGNNLHHHYLQLTRAAACDTQHGLMHQGNWNGDMVH